MTFTQALTAEIIETLSSQEGSGTSGGCGIMNKNVYEPPRFESSSLGYMEHKEAA